MSENKIVESVNPSSDNTNSAVFEKLRALKKFKLVFVLIAIFIISFSIPLIVYRLRLPADILDSEANTMNDEIIWKSQDQLIDSGAIPPSQLVMGINLSYNANTEETLSVQSVYRKNGYPPKIIENFEDYVLQVFDLNGTMLYEKTFEAPNKLSVAPPLDGQEFTEHEHLEIDEMNFTLITPWFEDAVELLIRDSETEVLTYSLDNVQIVDNQQRFRSINGEDLRGVNNSKQNRIISFIRKIISPAKAQTQQQYLNLVFIGDDFSLTELERFHSDAERMSQHLLTYEPFQQRASQILFHKVDNTTDLGCYLIGRGIVCDRTKVTNAVNSAGVPYDRIMVIWNNDTYSGSAWLGGIGMVYNGLDWSSEVYVHELGHSLARLADEYIASYPYHDLDKNCYEGTPPNVNWTEQVGETEYHLGCNYSGWYRSTEGSIMRSLHARYFNPISIYWINRYIDMLASEFVYPTITLTHTPTPTPSVTLTPTPTPLTSSDPQTPTPTPLPGSVANPTPVPTAVPTSTSLPTSTPTPAPTNTPTATPTTSSPFVNIIYPNGGETLTIGQQVTLTWSSNISISCSLAIRNDVETVVYVIGSEIASVGSYNWTVTWPSAEESPPGFLQPPFDALFEVNCMDIGVVGRSDAFFRLDP